MENPPPPYDALTLFGRISVHQDFFWFFSLLAWSLALIVWWRHPARRTAWGWFPAAASAAVASALIQFGMFNPTFDIFLERLVPGTVSTYKPALIDPYWLGDVLIGTAFAAMAAAWGWRAATMAGRRGWRWLAIVTAVAAALIHAADPARGGMLLVMLAALGAAALWPQTTATRTSRVGLAVAAGMPLASTVGPIAAWLGLLQRQGPPTPLGLTMAVFQMVVGGMMLLGLVRALWPRVHADTHAGFRNDARWFVPGSVLLLLAGLGFGIQTGRDNRNEIQQNRLRTTAAHARVFDPALLRPLLAPEFQIEWKSAAGESAPANSPFLASGAAAAAHQRLREVLVSTPFLAEARILILRDGWLVNALSSNKAPGPIEALRRATPADYANWESEEPYVEEAPVPEIGYDYYCRAPIVAPDGRMLGWLDCVRREYFLSVERRWRAAPFLVTGLGLVLLSLVVVQRQGTREREHALRAAAIAAEGSRIKTAFLANVSHELRTPLQSILGYSELLRQEIGSAHLARLDALRQQGELMTRLVNDLIDLSAVESGSFQLAARAVDPASLLRETVESLRPRAVAKGLELGSAIGAAVPAWILVDDGRLRQVLINLASNALKFTDRGSVTLSLDAERANENAITLRLTVRDTGPGIPAEQQARLFTPFTRLAQTAHKEGSGLGLALSAALCRAMGGNITLESDGHSGSCFTATVTAIPTSAPAPGQVESQMFAGVTPRVLVVDDNRLVRELFVTALAERGAVCRGAATGAEALAAARAERPDVVVLDLALPDGDGTDFVAPLRALGEAFRIIGVSAHAGVADRARALAAGMDQFIVKPVPLDDLWSAITGSGVGRAAAGTSFDPSPALGRELHAAFVRELPAKTAELAAAVEARNWTQVRAVAHYLRNSALVVRADALFAACTDLELAAEQGRTDEVQAGWRRCAALLEAAGGPTA